MKRIIMAFPYGNHSNRLFQNLHFEAFCKEYNIEYVNPSFSDMYVYYLSPCNIKYNINIIIVLKILRKIRLLKLIKNIRIFDTENKDNLNTPSLLKNQQLKHSHTIYVGGWYFRVNNLTEKYQDLFISKYTLKDKYIKDNKLLKLIIEWKDSNFIVIGVHIRRGDYKNWQDGKYNFNDNTYKKYMCKLEEKIKYSYNKNCHFIIFSNENVLIKENEYINISTNEWYIDHFLMGRCDYLIGPPSTFTLWASYIGKVKYFHIENDSGEINLNDFIYCIG